ncbi:MAG TPA: DUF6438 domain-containing protein [Terriglobales bacterium]|jgi:hypothetical protein
MAILMSEQSSTNPNPSISNYLFILHRILFALAFGFAITSIILASAYHRGLSNFVETKPTVFFTYWYFFLRAGVRFNSFFGQGPQSLFGMTIAFLTLASVIALLLLLAFYGIARTRFSRVFFDPIAGVILFLSFPVSILLAPGVDLISAFLDRRNITFALMILLFTSIVAGIVYLTRKWRFPIWKGAMLLSAYYIVFICLSIITRAQYGEQGWIILRNATQLGLLNITFLIVGYSAGLAWMLYARATRQGIWQKSMWPRKQLLLFSFPWLIFSIIPWLSLETRSISHSPDAGYVNITLKRGGCFGSCPIYTVYLNGEGSATYLGDQFVRTKGPGHATVSREKVRHLLQSFDNEHFFAMEDQAFPNCFDLPSTSITISIGMYSKTVAGDSCYGASWPKSGLLRLGQEIDEATNASQWVACPQRMDCISR